jgi:hypothetical protein
MKMAEYIVGRKQEMDRQQKSTFRYSPSDIWYTVVWKKFASDAEEYTAGNKKK